MPTIEIISVRFNLDKENDRKLFEEVQKNVPDGKRNEFLKELLYDRFMKTGAIAGKAKPTAKKQLKNAPEASAKERAAEPPIQELPLSATPEGSSQPAAADNVTEQTLDEGKTPAETSSDGAGLARSFMQ